MPVEHTTISDEPLLVPTRVPRPSGLPCGRSTGAERPGATLTRAAARQLHRVKFRAAWDRVRQVSLFELGALVCITPPFSWASGVPNGESVALLALLAVMSALWNAAYCAAFDRVEGRLTGRTADRRPLRLRILHALGLEGGLAPMTIPVIAAWTGMGWKEALAADVSLTIAYCAYGLLFNLIYDRVFPIEPEHTARCAPKPGAAWALAVSPAPGARSRRERLREDR